MVVELMGRHAGWLALNSVVAGSADVILIPEVPFEIEKVCEKIREREARGRRFSIVVVAEGAVPKGGAAQLIERRGVGTVDRLGGTASLVAKEIQHRTGKETRSIVLGPIQRGGSPTTFDRLLALRFGAAAARAVAEGAWGKMVALQPPDIVLVPMADVIGKERTVPANSDTVRTAREIGISFGD